MAYAHIFLFTINTMELGLINTNIWEPYRKSFWVTRESRIRHESNSNLKIFAKFCKDVSKSNRMENEVDYKYCHVNIHKNIFES